MARSLSASSVTVRTLRRGSAGLLLASVVAMSVAPATLAATSTNSWLAKIGASGANGTASVLAYTTGTGSVILKLKNLPRSATLAVTLLKTSCKGSALLKLASVKSSSAGALTKTSSLTAAQVTAIKKAATGTAKIAIRIGTGSTAKCGVFAVQLVPAYVAAKVTVGRAPSGVTIDASGVWVTNWWDNTLSKINPATNTVLSVVPLTLTGAAGPEAITNGAGSLWLTTTEFLNDASIAGSILRVDPASGAVLATIAGGRGAYDIGYGFGAVWVPNVDSGNVQRVDPATNQVVATIAIVGALGVGFDAAAVWVMATDGTVSRIDPATNGVVTTIHTQTTGAYVATGYGSIWVTHPGTAGNGDGSVSRIDPATNQVIANIPVGDYPIELSTAGGSVWVGLGNAPTVVRINAANNAILSKLTVSNQIYSLEATDHNVWAVHNLEIPEGQTEPPAGTVTHVGY